MASPLREGQSWSTCRVWVHQTPQKPWGLSDPGKPKLEGQFHDRLKHMGSQPVKPGMRQPPATYLLCDYGQVAETL